jgi:Xaa-Pro dipeptidase
MSTSRRSFLQWSAASAAVSAAGAWESEAAMTPASQSRTALAPVAPITDEERRGRIEKARRLMEQQGMQALVLEPGSSMFYFTGVRWGLSERPFLLVIPVRGDLAWVTPAFEEQRARELTKFSNDIRAWQEDESPYQLAARILSDRGAAGSRVGIEERLRFFIYDGLRKAAPRAELVDAVTVTAGCRMFKSPAEIALMQRANDITIAAFKTAFAEIREGMTPGDLRQAIERAFVTHGGPGGSALVLFGAYSAFPHGSVKPQRLATGDIVLVDGGCTVEGYQSDITRTTVLGAPSKRQVEVWNLEKKAQSAAFAAATVGAACEAVDAAARKVITDAGFGPGYKVPGLPHRTGHGIGLDGHEWTNFVRGNTTRLAPGMCFSDEPMIAIYGEFGIRLEDCLYITDNGPKFFTTQSIAIDQPFG